MPKIHTRGQTHIGSVPWISRLEGPWDLDNRRGRFGPCGARDVDLGAADVELRRAAGIMDAEGLDAQQVLAVGDALGDVVGVRLCGLSVGSRRLTRHRYHKRFIGQVAWPPLKLGPKS